MKCAKFQIYRNSISCRIKRIFEKMTVALLRSTQKSRWALLGQEQLSIKFMILSFTGHYMGLIIDSEARLLMGINIFVLKKPPN